MRTHRPAQLAIAIEQEAVRRFLDAARRYFKAPAI